MYLVIGIVFLPLIVLSVLVGDDSDSKPFGIAFALFMPILYAVIGFAGTALMSWFYNVLAARLGGIEIELSDHPS